MPDHLTPSERALRQAAEKATKGEWQRYPDDHNRQAVIGSEHHELMTLWHHCVGAIEKEMNANAVYIVAAQPRAVLALLDEIERLRGALLRIANESVKFRWPEASEFARAALTPKEKPDA